MTREIRRVGQHAALMSTLAYENFADMILETVGEHRFHCDLQERTVMFEGASTQVHGRAELIASVAMRPATLLWGWSQEFRHFVGPSPAAEELSRFGAQNGLGQFTSHEVPYVPDPGDGRDQGAVGLDLAMDAGDCAVEVLSPRYGPAIRYMIPTGGGSQKAVLLSGLSTPVPPVTVRDVGIKLPRLITSACVIDDLSWSLDGLMRLNPTWTSEVSGDAHAWTYGIVDPASRESVEIRAEFDDLGRLGKLNVSIR